MDKAIASGNDEPPGYLRIVLANIVWNVCGGFANQFEIAHGGIVTLVTKRS